MTSGPAPGRPGPLDGLRVVELGSMYVVPTAAQYLGDMGADVIKVEAPEGDLTRSIGPRRAPLMGSFYLSCNRNKRSVVLDLKRRDAREALHALLAGSDAMLTSIRSDAARRLGVTYDQVRERTPQLIHCQVTGYADGGPYSGRPAYDDVIQAVSGLAHMQRVIGDVPRYVPTVLADKLVGVHLAYAALVALLHRERTGEAQQVTVPMFETMAAFNLIEHIWGHTFLPPETTMGYPPVSQSVRRPYATADGYLSLLPYTDKHWHQFFALAGEPELADDPRLRTFAARQADMHFAWDTVERLTATKTTAEWLDILSRADVPFAPVNSFDDLVQDPHLAAVGFWNDMVDGSGEHLLAPMSPIGMRATPASIRRGPPTLGEHTAELLGELGYGTEDIARMSTPAGAAPGGPGGPGGGDTPASQAAGRDR